MVYYKSYRIINGKARWVVTDDDYNIIKNPTKEQLKAAILGNPPKKCCICGSKETYVNPNDIYGIERWTNHRCEKENCTGSTCHSCYGRIYNGTMDNNGGPILRVRVDHTNTVCYRCKNNKTGKHLNGRPHWLRYRGEYNNNVWDRKSYMCTTCYSEIINNMENSYNKLIKLMSKSRNGKLSKYSETGEGLIIEAVIAKIRKINISTLVLDSFRSKFDLFYDQEYGNIQSKGPAFDGRRWDSVIGTEHNFDTLFVLCMSINRDSVERVYIIPESELYGERRIQIYEDFSKLLKESKYEWVEKFMIDEKTKDIYDYHYQDLICYLENKEFFGIEDIKEWLKGGV